jgi:hypothetical protein
MQGQSAGLAIAVSRDPGLPVTARDDRRRGAIVAKS